jgi:tetratricopeptide (TPR) repeat protein
MRIGLNSGPVIVGSVGDDLRMDYTAIGDTVNLASRMESNAEPGNVLVSANTYRLARDYFEFRSLGEIHVKGKKEPVQAFQLTKPSEVETRIEASAAKGLTKFVGRKREFETLKQAFEQARSGQGQVVGVVGEAGVGKSRLLLEFRNSLPREKHTYLEGRSLHYGSSMPYLPILDALRSFLGIKEGERESVIKQRMMERIVGSDENLLKCLPPIQELFSVKIDDDEFLKLEPRQKRERTFEALRDILIRGSEGRPIILAVEDLHWIDKTTEEFLDYMIGWLPSTRMLLILLYRPEYTHQWGSKSYYAQIGVGQLSIGTSAELVQAILEGGAVVPELRELILSRASGNPLYMEELTHSLLENGSVQKEGDQYVLARKASEIQVPDTIQGIIAARMDRLEEVLKGIMQVASVIGREFAFRILQAIVEMKDDLKANLLNLQGLEFIYEKNLFPELEYIFRHALTQEVAYNSLLLKRRKEIHERIGRAIEELYPERLEEFYEMLAYHYSKSDNRDKAFHYLKLSGNKATNSSSMAEAFGFYKQAYSLLERIADTEDRKNEQIQLILLMASPMRMLGFPADSIGILLDGEGVSKEIGDEKNLAKINGIMGMYYTFKGDQLTARKYQETYFERTDEIEDVALMVPIAYDLSTSWLIRGEYSKVADIGPKVIDALERSQRQSDFFGRPGNPYSIFHAQYGLATAAIGDFKKGERLFEKALPGALQRNHVLTIGLMEMLYGVMFLLKGDGKYAAKHLENAIRCFEEAQATMFLGGVWAWLGWAYYYQGDLDTALHNVEKGLKLHADLGFPFWLSGIHGLLSMVHLDSGRPEKAREASEKALKMSQETGEIGWEGFARLMIGRTLGKSDTSQISAAEKQILQGIDLLQQLNHKSNQSVGYLFLGELYADTSQREKALENLNKAETMFQEMGMDYWLGKTKEVSARL